MSVLESIATPAVSGVEVGGRIEGLNAIHRPGCAAAIWRRSPLPSFQEWIYALPATALPRARVTLRSADVPMALAQICETNHTPDGPERRRLIDDVSALADFFANMMGSDWLRLRIDPVDTNACRRFHIDAVTARLVCTYRGLGTQFATANDGALPEQIHTVPTCSPIVLRGTLWPENPSAHLRHRSPPIEGTGETRLLLVLDPVTSPETPKKQRGVP